MYRIIKRHNAISEIRHGATASAERQETATGLCPVPVRQVLAAACLFYLALGSTDLLFARELPASAFAPAASVCPA